MWYEIVNFDFKELLLIFTVKHQVIYNNIILRLRGLSNSCAPVIKILADVAYYNIMLIHYQKLISF